MNIRQLASEVESTWTLFLDRDGVLNKRIIDDYVRNWEDWEWLPGALEAIAELSKVFGRIVLITNQRGIARGFYSNLDLEGIHRLMLKDIEAKAGRLDAIYYCPHDKDANCNCRKPKPGMLLEAAKNDSAINLTKAIFVGDSLSDMQAAEAAKVKAVFIGEENSNLPENVVSVVPDLQTFADFFEKLESKQSVLLDQNYWENRWAEQNTPWDMGTACPALINYLSQVENKDLRILIPGAGGAHEAIWLWENGFYNFVVLDWSEKAFYNLKQSLPQLQERHFFVGDFFDLDGKFDLVIEQTFFCALPVAQRQKYVEKMHSLLEKNGKIAGLLFDFPLESGPPFGGSEEIYRDLFQDKFHIKTMARCYNSIKPREGRELFIIFEKRNNWY